MLASLLPGLRELRASFAAGYIWLLGLWLWLHPLMPATGATGVYREIIDLGNWIGKPAILVAASFAAYLIGMMSAVLSLGLDQAQASLFRRIKRTRLGVQFGALHAGVRYGNKVREIIEGAVVDKLSKRFMEDEEFRHSALERVASVKAGSMRAVSSFPVDLLESPHLDKDSEQNLYARRLLIKTVVDTEDSVYSCQGELRHVGQKLLGREDQVYEEYARIRAEADFRAQLVLPTGFLFGVLVFRNSPWWSFGLVFSMILLYLSVSSRIEATRTLAGALAAGQVESSELDRLSAGPIEFVPYSKLVEIDGGPVANSSESATV